MTSTTPPSYQFASDNTAGVHPNVLRAIEEANRGHALAYGDDAVTARAVGRIRDEFGASVAAFFVFTGTAANVLGLQAATRPYHAVICARTAHINVDECGAPEQFTGCKLLDITTDDGKLSPAQIAEQVVGIGDPHHVQPRVVSISESTELGTVYTRDEIRAIADVAHRNGLLLHMDGARLANAAAALELPPRAITGDAGVDILSFGGTKNGGLAGEAVVFFDPSLARDFEFLRKRGMQLASKMRFVAAQFDALLADGLWHRNAAHANAMARRLAAAIADVRDVRVTREVQANAVFARLPLDALTRLHATHMFYVWDAGDAAHPEVRWMTAFDTSADDVDRFAGAVRAAVSGA